MSSPVSHANDVPEASVEDAIGQEHYDHLLHMLYDSVNHADGFNRFLAAFVRHFHCFTATLAIRDADSGQLVGGWFGNMPDEAARWYMTHLAHKDPLLNAADQCEKPRFVATNLDFNGQLDNPLNDPDIERWREQLSCFDGASALVYRDRQRAAFFTITRRHGDDRFDRRELGLFARFLPHLRRALKLQDLLVQQHSEHLAVVRSFDRLPIPLMLCDVRFQVIYCNEAARQWLADNPWMGLEQGMLGFNAPALYADFTLRLVNTIRSSVELNDSSGDVLNIPPRAAGNRDGLTVAISALSGHAEALGRNLVEGGALLTLHPWVTAAGQLSDEWLADRFALSPAESAVCRLLCQGQAVENIAEELNRGVTTIRSHLKSLYRKTGTARQAELVALVLNSRL
ncbi:MAG: helix-turn-helix transcriptional regulator [Pseudomonadota bacterium]